MIEVLTSVLALSFLMIISMQFFTYIQRSQALIEEQELQNKEIRNLGVRLKDILVKADVFFIDKDTLPDEVQNSAFYNKMTLPQVKSNTSGNTLFFATSELMDIGRTAARAGDGSWNNSGRYRHVTIHAIYLRPSSQSGQDKLNPGALDLVWYRNENFYSPASSQGPFLWNNGIQPSTYTNPTAANTALQNVFSSANLTLWQMGALADESPPTLDAGGVETVIGRNLGVDPKNAPDLAGLSVSLNNRLIRIETTLSHFSPVSKQIIQASQSFDIFSRHSMLGLE